MNTNATPHPHRAVLQEWIDDTRKRIWVWRSDDRYRESETCWRELDPRVISSVYMMTTEHPMVCSIKAPDSPPSLVAHWQAAAGAEDHFLGHVFDQAAKATRRDMKAYRDAREATYARELEGVRLLPVAEKAGAREEAIEEAAKKLGCHGHTSSVDIVAAPKEKP